MTTTTAPTTSGQIVRNTRGKVGITTDEPYKRTPRIAVMWVGASYPTIEQIEELVVIDASVLSA